MGCVKKVCQITVLSLIPMFVGYSGKIIAEEPSTKVTSIKEEEKKKKPLLPEPLIGKTLLILDEKVDIPEITFASEDSKGKSLNHYKGQVILLHFWATDCDPCIAELPALDRLQSAFKDDPFKIVAIAVDSEDIQEIRDFYKKYQVSHLDMFVDSSYVPEAIPISYLVDKEGKIVASIGGPSEWKQAQNLNMIRKYLGQ